MKSILETELYKLTEARHGRFLSNPNDIYLGNSMITYGEFSEIEWTLIAQLVDTESVVIEVGANMGTFTIPLARKIGAGGIVYAFEPQILVFQQLCANLALNDVVNVQAFNSACSDNAGWLPITRFNPAKKRNFGGFSLDMLKGDAITRVRIDRLDDILDPPRLTLIKADVEGMEAHVLRGANGLIEKFRPAIYVEAHDPEHTPPLIRLLKDIDYDCWWHLPPMFNADNFAHSTENQFGAITSKNMLCLPMEKKVEVKGAPRVSGENDHPRHW